MYQKTTYRHIRSAPSGAGRSGDGGMDDRVAALAGGQHGLGTRAQLRELGMTAAAIRWRVRRGRFVECGNGVYAVGHKPTTLAARRMAAVLAAGPGAALDRRSAAHLLQLIPTAPARISVVLSRRHRGISGVDLHHTRSLPPSDITVREGIPVTSVTRTILDLGEELSPNELAQVMHQAARRRRLNIRSLERAIRAGNGRRGITVVQRALVLFRSGSVGVRSRLESDFDEALTQAGVTGRTLNTRVAVDGETLEVDQVYEAELLCVEVDGPDHELPAVQREDARRDRLLRAAGWRVVRITHLDIEHDLAGAIDLVRQSLRQG